MASSDATTKDKSSRLNAEVTRQRIWRPLTLFLVLFSCGVALWMLASMDTPPSTAIVSVLIVMVGAILLVAVLFELTEFSLGNKGISAKIRNVEQIADAARDMAEKASERMDKIRDELSLAYGKETYDHRAEGYSGLWLLLEPLALYFREKPVDYDALRSLGAALREWYFKFGMFLTKTSRDRYFFLQDILQFLVLRKGENGVLLGQEPVLYAEVDQQERELGALFDLSFLSADEENWKYKLYTNFTPRTTASPDFLDRLAKARDKHFALVRCAASALRTQMGEDIGARERPKLERLA